MNTGKKSLAASLAAVVSLVTWWSQAKPVGGPGTSFTMQQLWSDWLPAGSPKLRLPLGFSPDTPRIDTARYRPSRRPRVAPQDRLGTPFSPQRRRSPLVLPLPSNVELDVQADDSLKNFDVREKLGTDLDYRDPSRMTFEEYSRWQQQQAVRNYFRQRSAGGVAGSPNTPAAQRLIPKIYLGPMADRIFGGSYVDIRPQGAVTLRLGARFNRNENPTLTLRQQRVGDFQYDQNLNLNLTGQIGEKLRLTFNYDTRAAFDFENNMKLDYTGYETDIIRKIELGNVSLPLNNSLIQGGQNLFGVKAQFQFGRLGITTVASTLRGQADEVRIQNGGQSRQFELKASQYERDRHYFLSQAFRDRYDAALRNLPTVQSGVEINNLEVYVTNDNRQSDNLRNVVALQDLGEPKRLYRGRFQKPAGPNALADNNANTLLSQVLAGGTDARSEQGVDDYLAGSLQLQRSVDYEHVRARKLDPREYTYNAQLGYISLNTQLLPEQVLAVSYQYVTNVASSSGQNQPKKVGEITTDYGSRGQDEVIYLKLLKATNPAVGLADPSQNPSNENLLTRNLPTWDLMMKNIYPLNASQLNRDNFQLQIVYKDDVTGVDLISLKEGQRIANRPLIEVLNLDNVNPNNDRNPDGNFDFFPGITIDTEQGRIIFPEVQPFGNYLAAQFDTATSTTERDLARKYVYRELYTQVQSDAQQRQEKDKFFLRGRFQATSTDEINLPGIGIAEGSVRVRAGSTLLQEGVDYQVFYDQAKVKILNPSYLNSANELRVEFEKNALVQVQPRKLLGARFDYRVSPDLNFGATVLHLRENQAPGINRVNVGDEPGNNTIYGFDVNMRRESRALTKYLDLLPLISTKEVSSVAFSGEFAQLLPGQSRLGSGESGGENGVSYLDDFENARTPYTLGGINSAVTWRLAATPAPLGGGVQGLAAGFSRAKLAWYTIDQTYYTNGQSKPQNVGVNDLKNHYVRGIKRTEVFPNRDVGTTGNSFEATFDLAYFPDERGQYNYNPAVNPSQPRRFATTDAAANRARYGGISREITFDTDFDNANVEYLEFWMMDPFLGGENGKVKDQDGQDDNNTTGGDLYINLGTVSEDVLKDNNRYAFENGLPVDRANLTQDTNPTPYGRVSRQPFLTDAFNATPGARTQQDVGLDGVNDDEEKALPEADPVYRTVPDPAADNFRHHLDPSYDQQDAKVLARYKDFNGMQGNSPEGSQLSSTAFPDKEDLNRDNVLTDTERYYEYRMQLRPGQLEVGQNFIVDKITNKNSDTDNEEVTWYQFRIPVRQPTGIVDPLQGQTTQDFGFKSIRFLRMYLTQWQQPVVLRLVQPQFVANQWRRYLTKIADPTQVIVSPDTDADAFNISTVSIEENGPAAVVGTDAIPYVLPPNIRRDREYGSSTVNRQQNEQSLRLVVEGLRDGFAKAAYKNINLSLLRYKRLKLFLHAENEDGTTRDGQLRGFVRLGTDYTQNYYEYSKPLILTKRGQSKVEDVWPEANRIDLKLQDFIDAKARRNQQAGSSADYSKPFVVTLPDNSTITVVGNPDLSAVQGVMIGILNPRDDNASKNLTLWADELRVSEFETENGWAATARFNAKLADIANITATGSYVTTGFGGLQDRAQQRSLDNIARGDVNATVAAEKFFPEKLGLRVPVLVQAGVESRAPKYDPLDPDTKLTQSLEKFKTSEEKAAYRKEVVDQTSQRSISVLNVRKERTNPDKKVRPYDVENFALSYSLTERLHTDIRTDRDYTRTYTGALAYVYQATPRNYTPLAKVKAFDSPYLKMLQEVNFTPLPSRFSFRADLDRRYNERFLQRTLEPGQVPVTAGIPGIFQKAFFFNRIYDLRWDLTKALAIDYTATNRAVVDENPGRSIGDDPVARQNRELLRRNLLRGGRTTNFNQTVAFTYRLPLDKFPLTDWLSADARYAANYTWQAASTALTAPLDPTDPNSETVPLNLGNTVQNNGELSANGRIDLVKLYNKVRFLNIINNAPPPQPRAQAPANPRDGLARRLQPGATDAATPTDSTKGPELRVLKAVLRSLMTARSLNFTYTRSNGTLLPGYLPGTRFFGLNSDFDAPGVPFLLGRQYDLDALYQRAYNNGWYTTSSQYLNTPLSSLLTEALSLRTTLEPFRDFNIQLDARRNLVRNREVFYRLQVDTLTLRPIANEGPRASNALGSGTFSTSVISIRTLFGDLSNRGEGSKAFQRFIDNRVFVQQRLSDDNSAANSAGDEGRYSYNSQDVLLPAFLDAYRGKSSDGYKSKKFNPFGVLPIPNWNIAYNGLAEVPFMQRYFRSITLNHAYSALYNINSYTTNAAYTREPQGLPTLISDNQQYIPYYILGQVTIAERLAPLIGLNFQTSGNLTGRLEYRIDRNIGLNIPTAQVTELHSKEIIIGAGFATSRLKLPFRIGGEQRVLRNELNARLDLSIRDNFTIQRTILDVVDPGGTTTASAGRATSQVTNGTRQVQLRPTVDYVLNQRLNLQFFFTQNITAPRVQNAFRNTTTEGGVQLRYSLSQ
ncbi:cell surface protein SprA [Hymenobacter luteus]|uniref:Cell surface protein SprA n=2 Tax=Hymenobacter TaxID=89966 RepID=A0A7W9WB09_9BACT|nr:MULTISPECIES: cell surface protein SprA [Hymenobacter]MBB4599844.1 cell surface protein SprA [Hymenobacter latericoloratus]MBB6057846.1 cell surface protein SprA [Hymenobacter luteus]